MMTWQKPSFTEVSMNAEIGSYQEDGGGGGYTPPGARADEASDPGDKVI